MVTWSRIESGRNEKETPRGADFMKNRAKRPITAQKMDPGSARVAQTPPSCPGKAFVLRRINYPNTPVITLVLDTRGHDKPDNSNAELQHSDFDTPYSPMDPRIKSEDVLEGFSHTESNRKSQSANQ